MKAYSADLRQCIVAAVRAGDTKSAVARRFCVERSTVRRYVHHWERTGSLAPKPMPDFNPIELAFSKIKTAIRQIAARTHDAVVDALGPVLETVRVSDAVGWYRPAGYFLEVEQPS